MSDKLPIMDGEEFIAEAATAFVNDADMEVSDDAKEITFTNITDDKGREVTLTFGLSQIIVHMAEYENPDDAGFTTEPKEEHHRQIYGQEIDEKAELVINGESFKEKHIPELFERAEDFDYGADFVSAPLFDDSSPPQKCTMYWVVVQGEMEGEEFYRHENY